MGRFVPLVFGALSALHVLGAIAQEIPTCIPQCANQLRAEFAKFACGSADDAGCLCAKADFAFGIRDCGTSCGATDANVHQFLVGAFCAGLMPAATTPATTPAATPSSTVQPPTSPTAQPSTTQAPVASTTPSSTSVAPATTQQPSSETSTASPSATAESTPTSSTSETSATPSTTSNNPASATSSEAAAGDDSGSGLPQAAVIGIGVGIGVAVIGIAGIGIGLLLRNRRRKPRQSMEISKPLPGSGRMYPPRDRDHSSFEKYGNDIEMTSNRYEDMVPRTQPRTMV